MRLTVLSEPWLRSLRFSDSLDGLAYFTVFS